MDEFGNQNPLSDWIIQKYLVRNENDRFRLRIGINSIGRHSSSDLRIDSTLVSRHHAEVLVPESGRSSIELRDLNSINGTYINNELYRASTKKLEENMTICFGAEYDEDEIEQLPIYKLIYDPINRVRICRSPIAEFIISDEEDHIDMKPMIKAQPNEAGRISTVGNILNIFGDADEAILDGLQRINPLVCAAVKKTTNAELVILSSDDEESPNMKKPRDETVDNCCSIDVNKLPEETTTFNQNDSNDPKSDDESEEENQLIYSQALINEIKSEMLEEADDESDNDSIDGGRSSLRSKQRSMSPQIISLIDDDDDDDDDDEDINAKNDDFDEDLERKVSNWTQLLFSSQIYPKMNSSQSLINDDSITNQVKESNAMSENSLIENLFKPLEDKLDNEKRERRASTEKRERRTSTEKRERRASTEKREKRASTEKREKRASTEKREKRTSTEKRERRASTEKRERRTSSEKRERRTSTEKRDKRASTEKRERRTSTEKRERRASTEKRERRTSTEKRERRASTEKRERRASTEKREKRASTEKREKRASSEKRERRASTERNPSNNEICSPIVKRKKRKIMRILDESDEESNYSDQCDKIDSVQMEEKSMHKSKEAYLDKPTEVESTIKTQTKIASKSVHRGPIIVTPPRMKFGRRLSTVSASPKANANGFLEKKRSRKCDQKLKDMRKERLKTITHKTDENNEMESSKSKSSSHENKTTTTTTTTKVKNTIHNRGAFLCEMGSTGSSTSSNSNSKATNIVTNPPHNFFKQDPKSLKDCVNEVKKIIRKNAERARERTAPKKLRFADVEKSFVEQQKIEKKAKAINSKLCPTLAMEQLEATTPVEDFQELDIIIPLPENDSSHHHQSGKPKKTVRFKDEPTIYYFESDCLFGRKVDRKDLTPRLTYRHRRNLMRRTFPNVDRTDDIISLILSHSNEWLSKKPHSRSTDVQLKEDLTPIPPKFESFDHYKSIFFPFMKLEFMSTLQRELQSNANGKALHCELQDIVVNKERILLVTKCSNNDSKQMQCKKCDLVLLEVGESKTNVFAYMVSRRKIGIPADRFNMNLYVEVMANSIDNAYLRNTKSITVKPAMDNLQVTIGAYNAIYQLETTPLSELLLDPTLLMHPGNILSTQLDDEIAPEVKINNPNEEQLNGIRQIYKKICFNKTETTPNVSLVQGPPGTGKSVVVVNLALQTIYGLDKKFSDKKILICAQSNCAIDSVAAKLLEARSRIKEKKDRFTLARFGIFEKMNPKVHPVSLHNVLEFERVKKLSQHLYPQFMSVPIWKSHMRKLEDELKALRLQSKYNAEALPKVETKKREIDHLHNAYKSILSAEEEEYVYKNYLWQSNIICTTLSSCVKLYHWIDYFDVCIIDEATQCTEPWTLLPLKFRISSLVLVGDSQQLPATVLSKQAADYGLSRSLLTRIEISLKDGSQSSNLEGNDVMFSLRVQYRMHPEICKFPNSFFYKNTLVNAETTWKNTTPLMPYSIFNLEYAQSKSSGQGKIINQLEADFVVELLKALNEYISVERHTYGVITPYAHQRKILADALYSARLPHVTVNTIDSYQGIEKDVIVISNARTNGVGFLANPQRLNVAITRPKMCLILCGNFKNLQSVPAWRCLLKDAQQRHIYYEIGALDISNIKTKVLQLILAKK